MKKIILGLALLSSFSSFASDWKVVSCWKGSSSDEQKANMKACTYQAREKQKCSDNMWEHGQAAYDVCLLESNKRLKIVQLYKGYSQKEQDANLKKCKKQETAGQVCVTDMWTHKKGAYDVALIQ
jgi:hypothetical protein